jgi:hypothetical protein
LELESNAKIVLGDGDSEGSTAFELNKVLPEGIYVLGISSKDVKIQKTLSSLVRSADYSIAAPWFEGVSDKVLEFLRLEQIETEKLQKKTGKVISRNIRPSVELFSVVGEPAGTETFDDIVRFTCRLKSGDASLNPLVMITAFYKFANIPLDTAEVSIHRTSIIFG